MLKNTLYNNIKITKVNVLNHILFDPQGEKISFNLQPLAKIFHSMSLHFLVSKKNINLDENVTIDESHYENQVDSTQYPNMNLNFDINE